uniref:DNA helicase Pif1-like 2B domain-containing protein n=1 Tax=Arundo donax TaxID=35708 RepID=A0A0A9A2A2_ARUDO
MRLQNKCPNTTEYLELESFNNWILNVGDGLVPAKKEQNEEEATWINIPHNLLLFTNGPKIPAIVNTVYPNFEKKYLDPNYLNERAILTPTNEVVDDINTYMLTLIPWEEKKYLSTDCISKCFDTCNDAEILYPIEYLNTLNANNFPQHRLVLKIGVPIILLRNLNQSIGLCNGTRLIVSNLADNVIEAIIATGSNIDDKVYIPRINLTTRGSRWPFVLNWR